MNDSNQSEFGMVFILIVIFAILAFQARRKWRPSGTAFGTASWASEERLNAAGMLGHLGLPLGRTASGKVIRLTDYCHILLVGATGSGKGVSIILPWLFSYGRRGSIVCFDTKGDLCATYTRWHTATGQRIMRIIRLAPFNDGNATFNPLDSISSDSPLLVDAARAIAEALVVRLGTEHDMHFNDKAVQVICALLVLVLLRFEGTERSLNTVQDIASDPQLLTVAAEELREMGGIPARLGSQLTALFGKDEQSGSLTKEGAGVMSTVTRHLSFLDSELVAKSVASSSFMSTDLLRPGTVLFLQIPPSLLDAEKGLLRCWMSTLVRMIGEAGDERGGEVLFLCDEASALGSSLPAVEEALVRGRSAGVRLLLAYQSDSQVQAAFKDKPTLLYDNCATQLYLSASSIETAERISKSLGEWTQVVSSYGENESTSSSWQDGSSQQGGQRSRGSNLNYSEAGRALLKPDEVLRLSSDYLIAFQRGMAPILGRRIKWYQDPLFKLGATVATATKPGAPLWVWIVLAVSAALIILGLSGM